MTTIQQTILRVEGMTCPSCVHRVDVALRDLDGIQKVQVRLREGRVLVAHDPSQSTPQDLVEALRTAGYPSEPQAD